MRGVMASEVADMRFDFAGDEADAYLYLYSAILTVPFAESTDADRRRAHRLGLLVQRLELVDAVIRACAEADEHVDLRAVFVPVDDVLALLGLDEPRWVRDDATWRVARLPSLLRPDVSSSVFRARLRELSARLDAVTDDGTRPPAC